MVTTEKRTLPKATPPRQEGKLKAYLKKALIEAYGHGIIPGWVVEMVFEVADLREA